MRTKHFKILEIRDFYKKNKQKLVVYARSITGNMADAEDVVQTAFEKILDKIQSNGFFPNDLKAFTFRTIHNTAIDRLRNRKDVVSLDHFPLANPAADNAENLVLYRDLNNEFLRLDQKVREILMLKIYAGLSFREISEVINVSAFTVATRYYRAVRELKKTWSQNHEN